MSAPRPSEADVETVLSADEVNAMTGDDIRFWIDNPFMTPDLITEKVCYWVTRSLAARDAEHEREVAALQTLAADQTTKYIHATARAEAAERDRDEWARKAEQRLQAEVEAKRALADLRGEIKALVDEWADDTHGRHINFPAVRYLRALLPRDDAAGAGGAG